jgi:type II secretory pathway pseudopilin PulG
VTAFAHKWSWLAPTSSYEAVQLGISKILIFGVIAYMLVLCARNFLSHTHNAIVNKQRQNALMTFKELADAARDEESKDVVLTHAAACIFAPQDTGYGRQAATSAGTSTPSIFGTLQHLTRSYPPSKPS